MLVSKTKQEDAQTLKTLWDIVGIGYESYMRTENPEILMHTEALQKWAERLKIKVATHDYTKEDESLARFEKLWLSKPHT